MIRPEGIKLRVHFVSYLPRVLCFVQAFESAASLFISPSGCPQRKSWGAARFIIDPIDAVLSLINIVAFHARHMLLKDIHLYAAASKGVANFRVGGHWYCPDVSSAAGQTSATSLLC